MNQTLKKLSENHYIIYDDSVDIEENCFCFKNGKIIEVSFLAQDNGSRITHSFGKELDGVDNRPLSEVEELLFGYDLEKLADEYIAIKPKYREYEDNKCIAAYKRGFKAAMELKKDKLFTIEEMYNSFIRGSNEKYSEKRLSKEEFIQSLQPTEWEIKINEQNKLELV
jgi:hypothetical protein